jgi:hypothetical protein
MTISLHSKQDIDCNIMTEREEGKNGLTCWIDERVNPA